MSEYDEAKFKSFLEEKNLPKDTKFENLTEEQKNSYNEFIANSNADNSEQTSAKHNKDKNTTTIDEASNVPASAPTQNAPEWQKSLINSWEQWAKDNNKIFKLDDEGKPHEALQFALYSNKENADNKLFDAQITYTSPDNISVKGPEGKAPDLAIFKEILKQAKTNGPNIEFGPNMSPEFKANLMLACLQDKEVKIINPPSAEEIKTWPQELQDAISKAQKTQQDNTQTNDFKQSPLYKKASGEINKFKGDKFNFNEIENADNKTKIVYASLLMGKYADKIKDGSLKLENAPTVSEIKEFQKDKNNAECIDAIKSDLSKYYINTLRKLATERGVSKQGANTNNNWAEIDKDTKGLSTEQIEHRNRRSKIREERKNLKTLTDPKDIEAKKAQINQLVTEQRTLSH